MCDRIVGMNVLNIVMYNIVAVYFPSIFIQGICLSIQCSTEILKIKDGKEIIELFTVGLAD